MIIEKIIFVRANYYTYISTKYTYKGYRGMKTKLNLTIDKDLVPKSKAFARLKGKSVSQFVEDLLRQAINTEEVSFVDRWRGKFKITEKSDPRYQMLKRRYQLWKYC